MLYMVILYLPAFTFLFSDEDISAL